MKDPIDELKDEIYRLKQQAKENQTRVDAVLNTLSNAIYDIKFGPYSNAGPTVRALLRGLEIDIEGVRKQLGDMQWAHE